MIGLHLKLYAALAAIALLIGAYFWVGHRAVEEYKAEQLVMQVEADKEQLDKYNKIAGELEKLKLKRAENARTIIKQVEKIVDRPVYVNHCWDADGLQYANEAIRGGGVPQPATEVRADSDN